MLIKRWLAGVILGAGLLVFFRHDGIPLAAAGQNRSESNDVRFEVASIRLNKETWDTPRWRVEPGGRYRATRMPLRSLIQTAFAIERDELIGGPRWLATERFDIVAQATG